LAFEAEGNAVLRESRPREAPVIKHDALQRQDDAASIMKMIKTFALIVFRSSQRVFRL
jgi:hypothetical protein